MENMTSAPLPANKDASVALVGMVMTMSLLVLTIAMALLVFYVWRMGGLGVFTLPAVAPVHRAPVIEPATDGASTEGGAYRRRASRARSNASVHTAAWPMYSHTQYYSDNTTLVKSSQAARRQDDEALISPRLARRARQRFDVPSQRETFSRDFHFHPLLRELNRNQRIETREMKEIELSGGSESPEWQRLLQRSSSLRPRSGPSTSKSSVAPPPPISPVVVPTPPAEATGVSQLPRTRPCQRVYKFPSRSNPTSTRKTSTSPVAPPALTQTTPVSAPSAEEEAGVLESPHTRQRRSSSQAPSRSSPPSTSRTLASTVAPSRAVTRKARVTTPPAKVTQPVGPTSGKKRHVFIATSIQHRPLVAGAKKRVSFDSVTPEPQRLAVTSPGSEAASGEHFVPLVVEPPKKRVKGVGSPTERVVAGANQGSTVHCCDPAFKKNREVWVRAPYLTPEGDKVAGVSVFLPATLVRLRLPQAPLKKEPTVFVKPGGSKKELSWMCNSNRVMWEVPKSCIFNKVPAGSGEKCDTCCQTNKQLFVTPDNLEVLCDRCADHPRETTCVRAWKRGAKPPTFGFGTAAGCDCSVSCGQHVRG